MTASIRAARSSDRDALYDICVRTGDSGGDATGLYRVPRLLGDVFVGPYLALEPNLAFVVDLDGSAGGYVLGAADTRTFASACEDQWWPRLRAQYAGMPREGAEEWLLRWIIEPQVPPVDLAEFPSHLHIDLLPEWQSGGWGRRLIDTCLTALVAAGSIGVHLGVGRGNVRAQGFYRHLGFSELVTDVDTVWMGLRLAR